MMGRGNELGVRLGCGLFFLVLGAPTAVLAQAPSRPPTDQPKHVQAPKKRLPDRAFVLVGAGDIARCQDPEGAQATAKLIEQIPGTVFAAGDLAYEKGSPEEFKNCYDPACVHFREQTNTDLANHAHVDST